MKEEKSPLALKEKLNTAHIQNKYHKSVGALDEAEAVAVAIIKEKLNTIQNKYYESVGALDKAEAVAVIICKDPENYKLVFTTEQMRLADKVTVDN